MVTGVLTVAPRGSVTVINQAVVEASGLGPEMTPLERVSGVEVQLRLLIAPSSMVECREAALIST